MGRGRGEGSILLLQTDIITILVYTYHVAPLKELTGKTKIQKGVSAEEMIFIDQLIETRDWSAAIKYLYEKLVERGTISGQ